MKSIKRHLNMIQSRCLSGYILLLLILLFAVAGCGSKGGGGGAHYYRLTGHYTGTLSPWFVDTTFNVTNRNHQFVKGLASSSFALQEDGHGIGEQPNLYSRSDLPSGFSFTLTTVLVIDNTPKQAADLGYIKDAAKALVATDDTLKQQKIAIVTFNITTGKPYVLQTATSNISTLNTAISGIEASKTADDLYGAMKLGLSLWNNDADPADLDLNQGFLVVVTDHGDNAALHSTAEVKAVRDAANTNDSQNKQVIVVAVGSEVQNSTDLENLCNAQDFTDTSHTGQYKGSDGFYTVPKAIVNNNKTNAISTAMVAIQNQMLAYADSFYWLEYKTSLTSKNTGSHKLKVSAQKNSNTGSDATYTGTFDTGNLFAGVPGVYFMSTANTPAGQPVVNLSIAPGVSQVTYPINVITYKGANNPNYQWAALSYSSTTAEPVSSDVAQLVVTQGQSTATLNIYQWTGKPIYVTVTDTANSSLAQATATLTVNTLVEYPVGTIGYSFKNANSDTTANPTPSTYYTINALYPWYVNSMFQVNDVSSTGTWDGYEDGLSGSDFLVKEGGNYIDDGAQSLNVRKHDTLPTGDTYQLKTVLLIDNSAGESTNLAAMKTAALNFVQMALQGGATGAGLTDTQLSYQVRGVNSNLQQSIAIMDYNSSGYPQTVIGFSSDTDALNNAINSITISNSGAPWLYSALIDGVNMWKDDYSIDPTTGYANITQGVMVALTDGYNGGDTYTLTNALNTINVTDSTTKVVYPKHVYMVGIGDALSPANITVLNQINNFAAGYFPVADPNAQVTSSIDGKTQVSAMQDAMDQVQLQLAQFAGSFYWLNYKSDIAQDSTSHPLEISIKNNPYATTDPNWPTTISGTFSTQSFFQGTQGQIYIYPPGTSPAQNPAGIDTTTAYPLYVVQGQGSATFTFTVATYQPANIPSYAWSSSDPSIVSVQPSTANPDQAILTAYKTGTVTITVTDTSNNSTQTFTVSVKLLPSSNMYGFDLYNTGIQSPWYVDAMFQAGSFSYVTSSTGPSWQWAGWAGSLDNSDFQVDEDGTSVSNGGREVNVRKHDALPTDSSYQFKTVLVIDNSPSQNSYLDAIKQAAEAYVNTALQGTLNSSGVIIDSSGNALSQTALSYEIRGSDKQLQQEIAIVAFDSNGNAQIMQPFTSSITTLDNVIQNLQPGYGTGYLYDAMLKGMSLWNDDYTIDPSTDNANITQGVMVTLTDGFDTSGLVSYNQVKAEIGKGLHNSIMIGIGTNIVSPANQNEYQEIQGLAYFGDEPVNATESGTNDKAFYSVPDPTASNLTDLFNQIQLDLANFANSFYWLQYETLVEPPDNASHSVTIDELSNISNESGSISYDTNNIFQSPISFTFKATSPPFAVLNQGDVYIDSTALYPAGINGQTISLYYDPNGIFNFASTYPLTAYTYDATATPSYTWSSGNPSMVTVDPTTGRSTTASIPSTWSGTGSTQISVVDSANSNATATVNVDVAPVNLPQPIVYYPFNGNANDMSGNGYNGLAVNAILTLDRFDKANSAYSFNGINAYIASRLALGPGQTYGAMNDLTVCAWIKTISTRPNFERIVDFDPSNYWSLCINNGYINFLTPGTSAGNYGVVQTSNQYNDGKWHFVCVTYEYDGTAQVQNIYVDGKLDGSEPTTKPAGTDSVARYGFIGTNSATSQFNGGTHSQTATFDGQIDGVLIFSTVLSPSQIEILADH